MTSTSHRHIFFAFLAICLLQAEGKASLRSTNDDVVERSEGTANFEIKGSDAFIVDDTLGLPNSAFHDDETQSFPAAASDNAQPPAGPKTERVGQPNKNIKDILWWSYFLMAIIQLFYRQREDNRSQFGVLYMADMDDLDQFQLNLYPRDRAGDPLIDNRNAMSPANTNNYGNYVCSRPVNVQQTMIHSENNMLQQIDNLWNAYRNRYGRTPNVILLYSWIMPCPDCTNLIINHFNRQPYANVQYRVVAYTVEGTNSGLSYMTPTGNQQSRQQLTNNNITVYKQRCNKPGEDEAFDLDDTFDDGDHTLPSEEITNDKAGDESQWEDEGLQSVVDGDVKFDPDTHTCKLEDSFQGCMVGCINADLCCSCKASGRKSMVVALVNELTKECATSDIIDCAGKWVMKSLEPNKRGHASTCTRPDTVSSNVQTCASKCVGRPLSKPLSPDNPSFYPGYLRSYADLSKLPSVDLTKYCKDIRSEGIFCTSYRSDSYTAGNTLCRSSNRCGTHGYKYSWCYVSWSNHWDYCCTGSCGFNEGKNYKWCKSGNTWQYCGNAGDIDIQHRQCVKEYPCGVHQEIGKKSYYWCYVDLNKNWDRCCQPWHSCGKHGKSYNWCYTGYKKETDWQYCKP